MTPTEINRRVAEACGLDVIEGIHGVLFASERLHDFSVPFGPERISRWLFAPWTEQRDAEWAAAKMGDVDTGRTEDLRWWASINDAGAVAEELPHALCYAILALKETKT